MPLRGVCRDNAVCGNGGGIDFLPQVFRGIRQLHTHAIEGVSLRRPREGRRKDEIAGSG